MPKEPPRSATKPSPPPGKGLKRAAPAAAKAAPNKKKPVAKPSEGEAKPSPSQSQGKKKTLKPKVILTKLKLNPGAEYQPAKTKVKDPKKETNPKPAKPKPKKVVVSKATKKVIKSENESKRATAAKIVRAVKDVKKARSVVASRMAKTTPKKMSDSSTKRASQDEVNVVKKHNIVKRVNKMSGKKPCVVSVKIRNAHSTVTLSVKQNKQVKKDPSKCSKSNGGKNDRSTISIVKKGIASRRKSTSKECTSQDSTPSQSPTRDTSPVRSKEGKPTAKVKKADNVKTQKKLVKQGSVENKKGIEDKCKEKKIESQDVDQGEKTELIINENVKIKTENIGDDQNMEIEFTNDSEKAGNKEFDDKDSRNKTDCSVLELKVKSPPNDYGNIKSIESTTSDEVPLEVLKMKQKSIKKEKDCETPSKDLHTAEKTKKARDQTKSESKEHGSLSSKDDGSSAPNTDKKKTDSSKQSKPIKSKCMSKTALKKLDQESKLKISTKGKEKQKDIALKQKVAKLVKKSKLTEQKNKKVQDKEEDEKDTDSSDQGRRRLKLLKFWNGPKRHRVASLNALAKVHCLYENESRSALNDVISSAAILQRVIQESKETAKANRKVDNKDKKPVVKKPVTRERKSPEPASTRSLRTNPGVRSVGRNFDILNVISSTSLSSSSSEESSDSGEEKKQLALLPSVKQKQEMIKKEEAEQTTDDEVPRKTSTVSEDSKDAAKKVKKRRRKRNELTMDLKDMVVRKRMASLNASAIMTASYSTEKKIDRRREEEVKKERKKRKKQPCSPDAEESSGDEDLIVRTTNNKQKVAVIVNQDTDVTITGVYVNSTTRSTHHEGYCSIAGMQYRISSTSHTQTEATAVSTETVLHSDHPPCLPEAGPPMPTTTLASPCKSYTPLSALSSMQPPGHPHAHPHAHPHPPPLSPLQRRHGCSSAFSAPHNYPPPPQPPPHADVHGNYQWKVDMPCCPGQPTRPCYYQPAGPLISSHHQHQHHHSTSASVSGGKLPAPAPAPAESSDTEVVLTTPGDNSQPPQPQPQPTQPRYPPQPYGYPGYQYYPSPPATSLQYPAQQSHYHQEVCYSPPSGYPPGYLHKGHYPPGYPPRHYGHQYYPPQEFYPNPPTANPPTGGQGQQVMVPAAPPPSGPSPMVDAYPPPQGYYPGYSAGPPPPPPCFSTHSSASRGLFIDSAYQPCPCPMQSCPKNVHTGPLTGASKGSLKNHQATPLPPVALALPLEPPGALGPPSPARGSAGMPPPPSPALATARQSPPPAGLLTISRAVTDAVMLSEQLDTIPDLVPKTEPIKLEVEDIVKVEVTEEVKCNRKRRKSLRSPTDFKRQAFEPQTDLEIQPELQDRLITPKEEPDKSPTLHVDKTVLPEVEKQLPLSDNGATVPMKNNCVAPVLNGIVPKAPKKRKTTSECEPAAKVAKCVKTQKTVKKKCVNRNKRAEENIAPEVVSAEPAKVVCRRSSKPVERRKSSSPTTVREAVNQESSPEEFTEAGKKKKAARAKKVQEKTKADHLLRSHGKTEPQPVSVKERRPSKAGSTKSELSPVRVTKKPPPGPAVPTVDPSAESPVSLPGLRRPLAPKWSNGWTWEGTPYRAKIFLNNDDGAVVRTCYPAMRHAQGDSISPRDCVLLKSGQRRTDLPYVAKVAAMWENPDDGEMMVSLLWYYRPEHTEQGRRLEDIPDEIFASRHKDTNSVACIEDKCFVLTFNEYCRYRKSVRQLEEGVTGGGRTVPPPEYPRSSRQPPGRVSPDLVFFCRRVYDFRQKRILKNPC